ncbi:MAG: 2-hydroxyglutaryl-CoA dehydratase, partial [Clostridiales bacterium]|nr:2-hydroxyglutaryl-CoA dehydratase [Clostridiales bacterium]
IRIRSLKAAMEERSKDGFILQDKPYSFKKVLFTEAMKSRHTILAPQMSPIHFQFIEDAFSAAGYNLVILPSVDTNAVNEGLRHVNNDACCPSIIVTGQLIGALKSGEYDLQNTSIIISQTGGGCRATNYIGFIRKALKDAGMEHIPVISLNAVGLEKNPGFKISAGLINKAMMAVVYGDLLMRVLYRTRPYERVKGSANELYESWVHKCKESVRTGKHGTFNKNIYEIVRDFDRLELIDASKPKVGLVGEILVKFHPTANNSIVDVVEREGAEAVMPDLMGFLFYCAYGATFKHRYLDGSLKKKVLNDLAIVGMEFYRRSMKKALEKSDRFEAPPSIYWLAEEASKVLSLGNQTGEGWFLTAEMIELIHGGAANIVCMQPFACLPNHITGKGMIKELKRMYPASNIVPVDYDPGASEVNQLNRIKLMLSTAFKNLDRDEAVKAAEHAAKSAKKVPAAES